MFYLLFRMFEMLKSTQNKKFVFSLNLSAAAAATSVEPLLSENMVMCPCVTRRPCYPVGSKVAGLAGASEPAFPVRSRKMTRAMTRATPAK